MNKRDVIWLLIRLILTVVVITTCLGLVSAANTFFVIVGVVGLLGTLYYWLPNGTILKEIN